MTANLPDLSRLYDEQIQSAQTLLNLLEDEELALKQRHIDNINDCAKRKQSLLQEFEDTARQRQNLNKHLYPDHNIPHVKIRKQQETLKTLLESVQRQNHINAAILSVSREFTQQMLSIIRGNPLQQATYDAFGQSNQQSKNQSLAKV